jgi:hypothetical protein
MNCAQDDLSYVFFYLLGIALGAGLIYSILLVKCRELKAMATLAGHTVKGWPKLK